jgi:F-type H+-transporting ATPase subunit gamma
MPSLETLQRKIETAQDLQSVVKTMKALAAVSIHQYEKAVIALRAYNHTLRMGIQILVQNHPQALMGNNTSDIHHLGVVIFGSDQGLCGQFNEKMATFFQEKLNQLMNDKTKVTILTIGTRMADRLTALGYSSEKVLTVPSSLEGITPIIQETVLTLEAWRKVEKIHHIFVFNNYCISSATYAPRQGQIFPLNLTRLQALQQKKWQSRCLPTFNLPPERLASALFRQHFFVALYRACAESLASENTSRLASMQIAEKNIEERLMELKTHFQQQRQTAITEELLDIVSGFEALNQESD